MTICQKVPIYIFVSINFIENLLILIILFITSRNIKLLKDYQKAYLVLSIILWIVICLFYLAKILSLIYTKIMKKKLYFFELDKKVKWTWIITNGGAYIFMLIGLIYDIILIVKGDISSIIYVIIYFIICFVYVIFSIFDYIYLEKILILTCHPMIIKKSVAKSIMDDNTDKKENEDLDNEANKTKQE